MRVIDLKDATATEHAGALLAQLWQRPLDKPRVMTLRGDLGAGKTTLVGGMLRAMGLVGHARSPTYTLIEPYELAGRRVYHLDLYRLVDPMQLDELGVRDLLSDDALLLVEWPEQGGDWFAQPDLAVQLEYITTMQPVAAATSIPMGRRLRLHTQDETLQPLIDGLTF